MTVVVRIALVSLCLVVGASLGVIVGTPRGGTEADASLAASKHARDRLARLRGELAEYDRRFTAVMHDLDAAPTPAAATAARSALFQLRVDMVAVEDELAQLTGRRGVARGL